LVRSRRGPPFIQPAPPIQAGPARAEAPPLAGAADFTASALPVKAQLCLAERDRNGLLSVVADCLDRILVTPNIPALLEDMGLDSAESAPRGERTGARVARKKRTRAVATPT
jgi:hypothetical protein